MQIGFVGLGRMGGNMVARIHRDSEHRVVATDHNQENIDRAEGIGASAEFGEAGVPSPLTNCCQNRDK